MKPKETYLKKDYVIFGRVKEIINGKYFVIYHIYFVNPEPF